MRIFYCPDIAQNTLPPEEALHAIRVLRLKLGDHIEVIDGKGNSYEAKITEIDKRKCKFNVVNQKSYNNDLDNIHLAIAPTKSSDRLEWMIEKVTEIGVASIHLVLSERTERSKVNLDRIEKKIISAAKQSHKYFFPSVQLHQSLSAFVKATEFDTKLIAHLEEGDRKYLGQCISKEESTVILIGPEGDFTPQEIQLATNNDYQPVTLGDYRLRTETAAVFATTILNNRRYS